MKSKRTKACEIKPAVREAVEKRDNYCCIFCGSPYARGEAHIVRRSQGGLGIETNVVTACRYCHGEFDNGLNNKRYKTFAVNYMKEHYPGWSEKDQIYQKGMEYQ